VKYFHSSKKKRIFTKKKKKLKRKEVVSDVEESVDNKKGFFKARKLY
jgi:hypothetical protein